MPSLAITDPPLPIHHPCSDPPGPPCLLACRRVADRPGVVWLWILTSLSGSMWIVGASVTHTGTQLAHSFQRCGHHLLPPAEPHRPSASLAIPLSLSDLWLGPGFGCRISPLPNLDWLFAMEKLETCRPTGLHSVEYIASHFCRCAFFWISTNNSELTWHDSFSTSSKKEKKLTCEIVLRRRSSHIGQENSRTPAYT